MRAINSAFSALMPSIATVSSLTLVESSMFSDATFSTVARASVISVSLATMPSRAADSLDSIVSMCSIVAELVKTLASSFSRSSRSTVRSAHLAASILSPDTEPPQSSQATANGVLDGVIGSAQGQTVEAFADTAITVDAAVSTSQAQSVEGLASGDVPVDEGIQPIHGYNFDNDRRLLKARREKEKRDKLSFAEQLEAIKPQVVVSKTDTEAAIEFVERINALRPFEQPESKPIDLEFLADSRLRLSESEAEDEAIALIIAALL